MRCSLAPDQASQVRQATRASSREQALGGKARAIGESTQLGPHNVLRHPAHAGRGVEAAIGTRQHALGIADGTRNALEAIGNDFRVLDEVGLRVDDAGNDQLVVSELP
jgi:hypothetical protein